MHLTRLVVAAVALPLFYLLVTRLDPFFFLVALAVVSVLAQTEFHRMYRSARPVALCAVAAGVSFLVFGQALLSPPQDLRAAPPLALFSLVLVAASVLIMSVRLFSVRNPASSLRDIAPALIGFLYIPVLLFPQYHLRLRGHEWILLLYGCVWASDSFAYYVGKGFGRRKLYPEMSPNKTVAGALGSVTGGTLAALVLGMLLIKDVGTSVLLAAGAAIGAVTIVGDLVESMFKRDAGVKDSSALIPGHGGILDKIDSVLFAGPALYVLTLLL